MEYSEEELDIIWTKARSVSKEEDAKGRKKDVCGAWIERDKHGKEGDYGWEVDHIFPKIKAEENGIAPELYNDIKNLRPLHHENNGSEGKGDNYPKYTSKITAEGDVNIVKEQQYTVNEDVQKEIEELFGLANK